MSFGLRFTGGEDGTALNAVAIGLPKFSFSQIGGPRDATITMTGSTEALYDVMGKIGAGVAITYGGADVWHGYLNETSMGANGFTLRASLDDMANAIRCVYTSHIGGRAVASGSTTTARNLSSIAKYGQKDLVLELAESSPQQAENYVREQLEKRAWPRVDVLPNGDSGDTKLELYCKGHIYRLGWTKPIVESNGANYDTADGERYTTQTFVQNAFPVEHVLGSTTGNMDMYATLQVDGQMPVSVKSVKIFLRKTQPIIEALGLDIGVGPANDFASLANGTNTGIGEFDDTLSKFYWASFELLSPVVLIPYENYTMKLMRIGTPADASNYFIIGVHPSRSWPNGGGVVLVDISGDGI